MANKVVIAGSLAQKPWRGGHTWVFLQYLLGFRKLGWDVLFLDRLEPEMCVDRDGVHCPPEASINLQYFLQTMNAFGLTGRYALLYDSGRRSVGVSRQDMIERVADSAVLLNVMGFLQDPEILDRASMRVFVDIDPGFGQMWRDLGLHDIFRGHDRFVTIGENIGNDRCGVPDCGIEWIATRPPIQLDYWQPDGFHPGGSFTTIASWRGAYGPVPYQGKSFGLRVHEFRKFATLPELTGQRFELALDMHPADLDDKLLLERCGWLLVDPKAAAGDPNQYRDYVRSSYAEFMVAKNMYVETQNGWFSDRSACYLASGKPVLVQDTGLSGLYPVNEGLLTFRSMEEAIDGVRRFSLDYRRHAEAARAVAAEFFDSTKVLGRLLENLCVN